MASVISGCLVTTFFFFLVCVCVLMMLECDMNRVPERNNQSLVHACILFSHLRIIDWPDLTNQQRVSQRDHGLEPLLH